MNSAETFASVGTPFAPGTRRVENGAVMARDPTAYVDERMGIVVLRLSWNVRGPGSDKLNARKPRSMHSAGAFDAL